MIGCLKCNQQSKKGELVINVYETSGDGRLPTSNQWSSGFIHVECLEDGSEKEKTQ